MSLERFESYYTGHAVWGQIDTLKSKLGEDAPERLDENERDHFDRIWWLVPQLEEIRDNPQLLVPPLALEELNSALTQLNSNLDAWRSGNGPTYLLQAGQSCVDAALVAFSRWPATKDRYQRGLLRASLEYQSRAGEEIEKLRAVVTELQGRIAGFAEDYTRLGADADASVAQFKAKIAEAEGEIDTQTERLDSALNGLQATFTTAESERAKTATAAVENVIKNAAAAAAEAHKAASAVLDGQHADGKARLDVLIELEQQARRVVGAIGLTGTATGYGLYAKQERKTANSLRLVAMASFVGAFVLFLVTLLATHVGTKSSWQEVAIKVGGSVALLAAGAYASHESAEHRRQERTAKEKELLLAALDPFIATLEEGRQREIKDFVARAIFVGSSRGPDHEPQSGEVDPTAGVSALTATAEKAIAAIKEIAGRSS